MKIFTVDAFTDRPFAGNPAAVCVLAEERPEGWMRQVAREMNLSETAFLLPEGTQAGCYGLRWFTPAVEVDLCGHATLASAHTLWETGRERADTPLRFTTRSGVLTARPGADGWIELDFPAEPATEVELPAGLAEALGAQPLWLGKGRLHLLAEVASEEVLRGLRPDFRRLVEAIRGSQGLIVTSRPANTGRSKAAGQSEPRAAAAAGGWQPDFISRYFAPGCGVDEDPVTGSAHCCLGPHWATKLGKRELDAFQASARGGQVRVRVAGERVVLAGQAVTVLRGELV